MKINKDYVKAIVKMGDIHMERELWQEAINTYNRAKDVAPQAPGLREKLRAAMLELKKSKRKDYYKILDVPKDGTED